MAQQTRDNSTRQGRALERHTGADGILKWEVTHAGAKNDGEIYKVPVTSVNWTRDYTTDDIQHNGSLEPTLTTTEIRYSGSFEYEGQNPEIMDTIMFQEDSGQVIDRNRPIRGKLTIEEYDHDTGDDVVSTITFERVLVTSNDRDMSVGDVSSVTFDWEAETMDYAKGSYTEEGTS